MNEAQTAAVRAFAKQVLMSGKYPSGGTLDHISREIGLEPCEESRMIFYAAFDEAEKLKKGKK